MYINFYADKSMVSQNIKATFLRVFFEHKFSAVIDGCPVPLKESLLNHWKH